MTVISDATPSSDSADYGAPISQIISILRSRWLRLTTFLFLGVSATTAVIIFTPRYFVASVVVLPPQQQQSAAASALSQLGALAGMAGAAAGVKSQDEMYVALLKTRKLRDELIKRFGLLSLYGKQSLESARAEFSSHVEVDADKKSGLITVTVEDLDAGRSAELANAHVDALKGILGSLAVTESQQRRTFYEQQVAKAKEALAQAEIRFKMAQTKSGMVASEALAEAGVRDSVQLRAQITAREVALQAASRFATDSNPEVKRMRMELDAFRAQLARKEHGTGITSMDPNSGIEATQAFRDVKVQENLLELLLKQYEMAKADEAREGPLLQVVDPALAPERAERPRRSLIAFSGLVLTMLVAIMLTLIGKR